jgi:hypothetical protein
MGLLEEIAFGDQSESFASEYFKARFGVVDHNGYARLAARVEQEWVGLHDIDLTLQQGKAYLLHGVPTFRQFDTDKIAFDDRQPSSLEDLTSAFSLVDDESHERALGCIADGKGDDTYPGDLETTDDLQKLADSIFEEQSELAKRWVVAASHRLKGGTGSFTGTHDRNTF